VGGEKDLRRASPLFKRAWLEIKNLHNLTWRKLRASLILCEGSQQKSPWDEKRCGIPCGILKSYVKKGDRKERKIDVVRNDWGLVADTKRSAQSILYQKRERGEALKK